MRKYIIYASALLMAVTSCDSLLDKQPLDQLASETFWKTESDVEMALTACYSMFNNELFSWDITSLDGLSDDLYTVRYDIPALSSGIIESTSGGAVKDIWNYSYKGIAKCNFFLDGIEAVEMDAAKKDAYKAEARFLRAYFYFYLVEFYGGVPVYLTTPTVEEAKTIARSSKEDVLKIIYEDLDFAIEKLADKPYNGHCVKASAIALKSRVLLHNEQWADAAQLAKQVVDNSNFGLSEDYKDIWDAQKQENNPEIIFSVKYLNPDFAQPGYGADIVFN